MAFCEHCGSELPAEGKFCTNCGAPIPRAAAPKPPAAPVPPQVFEAPKAPETPVNTASPVAEPGAVLHKGYAALSYLGILVIIPLIAARKYPFAWYHANQGLVLCIFSILCQVIGRAFSIVGTLGGIITFVFIIIGLINVANGNQKELPVLGKIRLLP